MAVKVDSGPCPACNTVNSFSAMRCRSCSAALPWVKGAAAQAAAPTAMTSGAMTPSAMAPTANAFVSGPAAPMSGYAAPMGGQSQVAGQPPQTYSGPSRHVSNWNWSAMGVQIFGGMVFIAGIVLKIGNITGLLPTFPFAGYITMVIGGVIWRAGAAM